MSSSAGANSTSVTVSSLSRPSSSSVTSCSSRASLARGSPHSKSLKLEEPPKSLPRRSVPNVLEEASMKTKVDDLVLQQQNNVGSSTSTIVVVDKDALQLKWESTMGSKYTIVVSSTVYYCYWQQLSKNLICRLPNYANLTPPVASVYLWRAQ